MGADGRPLVDPPRDIRGVMQVAQATMPCRTAVYVRSVFDRDCFPEASTGLIVPIPVCRHRRCLRDVGGRPGCLAGVACADEDPEKHPHSPQQCRDQEGPRVSQPENDHTGKSHAPGPEIGCPACCSVAGDPGRLARHRGRSSDAGEVVAAEATVRCASNHLVYEHCTADHRYRHDDHTRPGHLLVHLASVRRSSTTNRRSAKGGTLHDTAAQPGPCSPIDSSRPWGFADHARGHGGNHRYRHRSHYPAPCLLVHVEYAAAAGDPAPVRRRGYPACCRPEVSRDDERCDDAYRPAPGHPRSRP